MFGKLTRSFMLQLFIDRILCARNSPKRPVFTSEHSRNNSSLHGIYIPVGNTDIKQQIIQDVVCWRVLSA